MKALFLAGGMGTRLKPLTDHLPKPMVPIMGVPLLERNIEELKRCGADGVVLSICYQADRIEKYFSCGKIDGLKIYCVCEDAPLGTGGAIKNCQKYFNETFLIFNSDVLWNIDLKELVEFHRHHGADATIATTHVKDPSSYGVIEADPEGFAKSFVEKPKPGETSSDLINAGIYVFEPTVLDMIPAGKVVSIEKDIFPMLLKNGKKIAVYSKGSYWIDIGTPEKYMQAHKDIFDGKCSAPESEFKGQKVYGLEGAQVHPSAKITGPVWLGKNVRIGANASIGPNVVVGNGFQTGRGCVVKNSVVWNDVSIASGVHLSHSVVTDGCRIGSGIDCTDTIYSQDSKIPFQVSS